MSEIPINTEQLDLQKSTGSWGTVRQTVMQEGVPVVFSQRTAQENPRVQSLLEILDPNDRAAILEGREIRAVDHLGGMSVREVNLGPRGSENKI